MAALAIRRVAVSAYKIPTSSPEADGTLAWDSTTLVLVRVWAGDEMGLGYSYAHQAVASLIQDKLVPLLEGADAMAIPGLWRQMLDTLRNLGQGSLCAMAVSAVDNALWDLKARLLQVPLAELLGVYRAQVPIYGSGGFTSYSVAELQGQLGDWVAGGISRVKMKVGSEPPADIARVHAAREAIGDAELLVDANGAYDRKQALAFAEAFAGAGVSWFEEPVSSDDREGLRLLRDRVPAGMEISAGEYGYRIFDFRLLLGHGCVDVLQADATRCAGISGFLQVASLCAAHGVPLSAHTAPTLHLPLGCAIADFRHLEYFHDHVRIEALLFDGAPTPEKGQLAPDLTRPGLGLAFREQDASRYAL